MKNKQEARNTAAGMVRDALARLVEWEAVQDLRHYSNTDEKATRLLDLAEAALSYFERHYDFPQEDAEAMVEGVRNALDNSTDVYDYDLLHKIDEIVNPPSDESEVTA